MISGIEPRYQRKSVRMRNRQLFDGERLARRLGEYGLDGLLNPSRTYTHDRLSIKCFHCVGATQRKHLTQGPRSNNQPTSAIASAAIITMPATARHVRSSRADIGPFQISKKRTTAPVWERMIVSERWSRVSVRVSVANARA